MRKPSKKESLLLKILAGAVVLLALGLFLAFTLPEASRRRAQIEALEKGIGSAKTLEVNEKELGAYYDGLKAEIQKEKKSFYEADEQDLTRLGIRMLALLKQNRLTYSRLVKVNTKESNYLEIALSGDILSLLRFLGAVYAEPKYLNIFFLTVSHQRGQVKATLRMNYGMAAQISH